MNIPLAPGSGDVEWLAAVGQLFELARSGRGASRRGPAGRRRSRRRSRKPAARQLLQAFAEAGRQIGALGVPTVLVQEGGYDLGTLGDLVSETLLGVEEGIQ